MMRRFWRIALGGCGLYAMMSAGLYEYCQSSPAIVPKNWHPPTTPMPTKHSIGSSWRSASKPNYEIYIDNQINMANKYHTRNSVIQVVFVMVALVLMMSIFK